MQKPAQLLLIPALTLLTFVDCPVRAQGVDSGTLQTVTITATALVQGQSTDNGTTTTTAAPRRVSITTKSLLAQLAADEFKAGHWFTPSFPPGARLVMSSGTFQVVDRANSFLVDVSDLLSFQYTGMNDIASGRYSDAFGPETPPFSLTQSVIGSWFYGYSVVDGGLQLTFTGLHVFTSTATAPNSNTGIYTETDSFKLQSGAGEGYAGDIPLIVTGTISGKGSGKLQY